MHKVKIESMGVPYAKITLDGKPVRAQSIDVHLETGCVPVTDISFISDPELEIETLVTVDFTPKTVESAVKVLKAALKKNDFVAFMGLDELNRGINEKR